jgi:ribosomal protein S18 acetylase RimI-like enzyme
MPAPELSPRDEVRPSDREHVRKMVRSTSFFSPEEEDVAVELVEERLTKGEASGYHFLFLDSGPEPVAYACYGPVPCTQESYHLYWIVVAQELRGQGLGPRLMRLCEERIRSMGGTRVYAETSSRPQYAPTRRFYEKIGFSIEARLKDYYCPGEDLLIFTRVLNAPGAPSSPDFP